MGLFGRWLLPQTPRQLLTLAVVNIVLGSIVIFSTILFLAEVPPGAREDDFIPGNLGAQAADLQVVRQLTPPRLSDDTLTDANLWNAWTRSSAIMDLSKLRYAQVRAASEEAGSGVRVVALQPPATVGQNQVFHLVVPPSANVTATDPVYVYMWPKRFSLFNEARETLGQPGMYTFTAVFDETSSERKWRWTVLS